MPRTARGRTGSRDRRAESLGPALREAARRYGTPLYVTDETTIAAAARELRAAFPDPWIRQYSVKANDVPAVIGLATGKAGASGRTWSPAANGRSPGRAGIPNDRISFEGVGKTDADLAAAVRAVASGDPLLWVALESADEAEALAARALRLGLGARTAGRRSTSCSA